MYSAFPNLETVTIIHFLSGYFLSSILCLFRSIRSSWPANILSYFWSFFIIRLRNPSSYILFRYIILSHLSPFTAELPSSSAVPSSLDCTVLQLLPTLKRFVHPTYLAYFLPFWGLFSNRWLSSPLIIPPLGTNPNDCSDSSPKPFAFGIFFLGLKMDMRSCQILFVLPSTTPLKIYAR